MEDLWGAGKDSGKKHTDRGTRRTFVPLVGWSAKARHEKH